MGHNEKQNHDRMVVFVCEHGSAKSVIAAAFFDKLARERGLTLRAVARGTQPVAKVRRVGVDCTRIEYGVGVNRRFDWIALGRVLTGQGGLKGGHG